MRLKIRGCHLTCKVANKYVNVGEQLEVGERIKKGPLPSHVIL